MLHKKEDISYIREKEERKKIKKIKMKKNNYILKFQLLVGTHH